MTTAYNKIKYESNFIYNFIITLNDLPRSKISLNVIEKVTLSVTLCFKF